VVNVLTCRNLDKRKPTSNLWIVFGFHGVAIKLIANFANAATTKSAFGYSAVSLVDVALLWSTRPRLAWIVLLLANVQWKKRINPSAALSALLAETILQGIVSVYLDRTAHMGASENYDSASLPWKGIPNGTNMHIMYASALLWVVFA